MEFDTLLCIRSHDVGIEGEHTPILINYQYIISTIEEIVVRHSNDYVDIHAYIPYPDLNLSQSTSSNFNNLMCVVAGIEFL